MIKEELLCLFKDSVFEHGIEKETLRVHLNGKLATSPHPKLFGSPAFNPLITLDFCEAQLELVTSYYNSLNLTYASMNNMMAFIYAHLDKELLWPYSAPCKLPDSNAIPIADFGFSEKGVQKRLYREGLKNRYGAKMQTVSGLHYNFSFQRSFWEQYFDYHQDKKMHLNQFISEKYFHIMRNYFRMGWLISYLFGASPAVDGTYYSKDLSFLEKISRNTYIAPYGTSLRMSSLGYYIRVKSQTTISFNSFKRYCKDLKKALKTPYPEYEKFGNNQINSCLFQIPGEMYGRIRAKTKGTGNFLKELNQNGVTYLEVRSLDLNPFYPNTIDEDAFVFLTIFLSYCLVEKSPCILKKQVPLIYSNQNTVAIEGRKKNLILRNGEKQISLKNWGLEILEKMEPIAKALNKESLLKRQIQKLLDQNETPSAKVIENVFFHQKNLTNFCLKLAQNYKRYFLKYPLSSSQKKEFKHIVEASLLKQQIVEGR